MAHLGKINYASVFRSIPSQDDGLHHLFAGRDPYLVPDFGYFGRERLISHRESPLGNDKRAE